MLQPALAPRIDAVRGRMMRLAAFLLLLHHALSLWPAPSPQRRVTRRRSTVEDEQATRSGFAGAHGPADSEAWLAQQGLVQPGASPEIHAIARAARRKKQKGTHDGEARNKQLALRPKKARWGDANKIRDLPVEGGWSQNIARGASTRATDAVAGEKARRCSQILVATQGVAVELRDALALAKADFGHMAEAMSLCTVTKAKIGDVGWLDASDGMDDATEALIPLAARLELMAKPLKPGDVAVVQSHLGYHVIKIDDVMRDLSLKTTRYASANYSPVTRSQGGTLEEACAGKTYAMVTMGCQMNAADSERLEGGLIDLGLTEASSEKDADLIVLNTCSIREHAEAKVYSFVGPQAKRKRNGEDVTIIVAGCVAQQEGARLLRRAPEVDVVMGPQYANRLADVLEGVMLRGEQVEATSASYGALDHGGSTTSRRSSDVVAWVNVAHGCNERCTYCVVPNTRGVEQSRTPEDILAEIDDLGARSYREVTLLGQNVDAYGRDMRPRRTFADLLSAVADMARKHNNMRVRFVTSHPRYITESVIDTVAHNSDVLMPVFHMPAQSGDDEVLRLMGRGYDARRYLRVVRMIRDAMPDATVSGDFIVGCPGESDEAFERTLDLMDAVVFDACMTAAFSPRPGTPMAHWDGASEAFGVLGVDLWRLKSVDEARTAVHAQFKALAKSQLTVMHNGVHDETWDDVVVAKRAALDALDRADAAPPSAFHPLSGVGPAQVPDDVKEKRLYRMKDRADAHALARSQRYAGRTEAVLVESRNTRVPTQVVGRTRGNKLVFFEGAAEELVGRTVDVRILNASTFSLIGERVS